MKRIKIDPMEFPKRADESWWLVHPNNAQCEFRIPSGAITVCTQNLFDIFKENKVYSVISSDNHNGWVVVAGPEDLYEMPQYLFARHFDAEVFVIGTGQVDTSKAKPFNYKPTLPRKPAEEFEG